MRVLGIGAAAFALIEPTSAVNCTQDQIATSNDLSNAVPLKCNLQLPVFEVCDDDCLASYKARMEKSPNCTIDGYHTTTLQDATEDYESCQRVYGLTVDKYMPQLSKGTLTKCTTEQDDAWYAKHGIGSAYAECWSHASPSSGCSDSCLSIIEQGVSDAPVCADISGYWYGEAQKEKLVRCLNARKEPLNYNLVLNTVVNADGSKTVGGKGSTNGGDSSASTPSAKSDTSMALRMAPGAAFALLVAMLV